MMGDGYNADRLPIRVRTLLTAMRCGVAVALAAGLVAVCSLVTPAGATASDGVLELPVSFHVTNTNTSGDPCPSDGGDYTVRGHIIGPRSALEGSSSRPITVYLTGLEVGEWNFHFTAVPGYDWPTELAGAGQVSLIIDMLGYGASGHPPGDYVCWGSQADVTHQIVGELRGGDYQVDGHAPLRFSRIVLAGHDVGGAIAQIEAYSYQDIDGLIILTWADQGQTPLIVERSLRTATVCPQGGENAYPGGPGGYFYMEHPNEYEPDLFYNYDPAVLAAFVALRERNPCGYEPTTLSAIGIDQARLGEIHVPVLLAIGAEDKIWTQDGWAQQQGHFTGTSDVTAVSLANTGHYPMLERTAPQLRALVATWLTGHGFAAATSSPTASAPSPSLPPVMAIPRQAVTVGRDRIARVRLTCRARPGSRCEGVLRLEPARLASATHPFQVASGRTGRVRMQMTPRGYRLLERRGHASATAIAVERGATTVRGTVHLRPRR